MGVFGWLLKKFDQAVVGKEFGEQLEALLRPIVDRVNAFEDIETIDEQLSQLAGRKSDADAALLLLAIHFPTERYGGRVKALVQSLPEPKNADWRETLVALSKLRGEVAAVVVDEIVNQAVAELPSGSPAIKNLGFAQEKLVAQYRKGEPLKFVQEALDGV